MGWNRLYRLFGFAAICGMLLAGCSKDAEESTTEANSFQGRWLLSITQQFQPGDYRDVAAVLLEITSGDEGPEAKILGHKSAMPDAQFKAFSVTGDSIKIVLSSNAYTYDFEGRGQGGNVVLGNVDQGQLIIEPAKLERTTAESIDDIEDFPWAPNRLEYMLLLENSANASSGSVSLVENYEAFNAFCVKHSKSPLAVIVTHDLVNVLPQKAESETDVKVFAKQYLRRAAIWGDRMEMRARFQLGRSLARDERFADLGLDYLRKAREEMDEETEEALAREIADIERTVAAQKVRRRAEDAFAKVQAGEAEALETLRDLSEETPFDPLVLHYHAEAAQAAGQTEKALRINARLATWPGLQGMLQQEPAWVQGERKLPEGLMVELYAKKFGNLDGIAAYQNDIYEQLLERISQNIHAKKQKPAGNRVALVELFTGAGCRPCVGADLATGALEQRHSPAELIVLRHHLHSNGLDPLAHPRNLERFQNLISETQQDALGTPSVFINGKRADAPVGGFLHQATQIATDLDEDVNETLEMTTPLTFQLSAYRHEDEVSVNVKLGGLENETRDDLRVHLLLVEDAVTYAAQNGIRVHDKLTRWYFEEGKGLALPSEGDFQFAGKTTLKEIRELFEASTRSAAAQMEVEIDGIPLGLEKLQLVAFVQNAKTREILQSAMVPVNVYDTAPPSLPNAPVKGPSFGPKLEK